MNKKLCLDCKSIGHPILKTPGYFVLELILWILFIVPGFIYSLWRVCGRKHVCKFCGSKRIVPLSTPVARAILRDENRLF